ncbi:MAG TPA: site-specific DNA-methyltransferase [Anaerolineales bacterium]
MNNRPDLPFDQILQGDCIEILASLPEASVDLVFADPPYNLQLRQELWRPNQTRVDGVDDAWDQFSGFQSYDQFTRDWLLACRRVLKRSGALWVIGTYHNIFRVGAILQDLGFWILNSVEWIKTNPMPNFRGVRFTNAQETLIWAQKERGARYTFNHHAMKALNDGLQMRSDWYLPVCTGAERLRLNGEKAHSTQKPEALLYRVLLSSTNPGDVVLDPFFGSGTTGVVARRLNRRWIGIEREPAYVDLARQRIADTPQVPYDPALFDTPNPRQRARIAFGLLLEAGLLQPGQRLYWGPAGEKSALILADGAIEYNGQRGSIHQIGRQICQAPCNGWDQWYYFDKESGERRPIDHLRDIFRNRISGDAHSPDQLEDC